MEINLTWPVILINISILAYMVELSIGYKKLPIESGDLCSPISKRKIKLGLGNNSGLVVFQTRLNDHSSNWTTNLHCKFEVQSSHLKGGIIAVIQKLQFRKDPVSGQCIDYIQYRDKNKKTSQQICDMNMNNSYIDDTGELDIYIHVARTALQPTEEMDLLVLFTSYGDCKTLSNIPVGQHRDYRPCGDGFSDVCIHKDFFFDGYINCPYPDCADETFCFSSVLTSVDQQMSIGNKLYIGAVSSLLLIFALFVLCIWAFRKHKLLCWADNFAHPSPTPENNRNSRVVELNEQTGARLAEPGVSEPSAPVEEDKDLPPSYESLFPDSR